MKTNNLIYMIVGGVIGSLLSGNNFVSAFVGGLVKFIAFLFWVAVFIALYFAAQYLNIL